MNQKDFFSGKNVLVTGGAGSIGKELVKHLMNTGARTIRVLDTNETGLFDLAHELNANLVGDPRLRFLLGDITDQNRLITAMENVQVVFHAAALKHVPVCEYNPFEAAKINVMGTQNCIDAARRSHVQKFVFISTDKAVSPFSVMGATKLVAERLVLASNIFSKDTAFSCVRFGNVLNSRGSVVPVFKSQILQGGPVTVTDPAMTRFFMTLSQAVRLILTCAEESRGDEVYVLKMPAMRILDLARAMIAYMHATYETPADIAIECVGIRPGEKLFEELISTDEIGRLEDRGQYFTLSRTPLRAEPKIGFSYASNRADLLTVDEIVGLLQEISV
ncbi:MAG: polysaccharide biosynthesis protein [Methanomicrobiales archaeon]|nr:polysaccharide biosynthesis protein [Methanomicrobiales archaeon]